MRNQGTVIEGFRDRVHQMTCCVQNPGLSGVLVGHVTPYNILKELFFYGAVLLMLGEGRS